MEKWKKLTTIYFHFSHPIVSLLCSHHIINPQYIAAAAAAKSLQSCPTLCDPIDCSPPGSPILGILQARTLEWVAISFSSVWEWKVKVKLLSCVRLLATPWTAAHQAPPSMGFSRQEHWSGVPLPSPIYCYYFLKHTYVINSIIYCFAWSLKWNTKWKTFKYLSTSHCWCPSFLCEDLSFCLVLFHLFAELPLTSCVIQII